MTQHFLDSSSVEVSKKKISPQQKGGKDIILKPSFIFDYLLDMLNVR